MSSKEYFNKIQSLLLKLTSWPLRKLPIKFWPLNLYLLFELFHWVIYFNRKILVTAKLCSFDQTIGYEKPVGFLTIPLLKQSVSSKLFIYLIIHVPFKLFLSVTNYHGNILLNLLGKVKATHKIMYILFCKCMLFVTGFLTCG